MMLLVATVSFSQLISLDCNQTTVQMSNIKTQQCDANVTHELIGEKQEVQASGYY